MAFDTRAVTTRTWLLGLALMAACSNSDASEPGYNDAATLDGSSDGQGDAAAGCAREDLVALVDDYFSSLEAHDAMLLPLAADVKITENAKSLKPGQGLWKKASDVRFKRSAIDTERCGTHTQAILQEDGEDIIVGVRLQLDGDRISEIETYITHAGDYVTSLGIALFSPDGVIKADELADSNVDWEEVVPKGQRAMREELNQMADLYFESFGPRGIVAPITEDCYRWENGFQTTFGDCSDFLPEPGTGVDGFITHRRYPIADVEQGIAVGYVLFRDSLDFHMFKVVDSKIRLIQAVVTATGYSATGWED